MGKPPRPECSHCGKRLPDRSCPGCGRPVADSAERFYRALLRTFAGDEEAHAVIVAAFAVMQSPEGGGCANPLDAFLGMCRSVIGEYGGG